MRKILLILFRACWIVPIRGIKFKSVTNYHQLYEVAVWEIKQLSLFGPVVMVSTPLFSGGTGNFHKNLAILSRYIKLLSIEEEIVWSQVDYLDIHVKKWANIEFDSSKKINEFYVPLIQSGGIKKLICTTGIIPNIPNYLDSLGCKTERDIAIKSRVRIEGRLVYGLHQ